MNTALIGAAAMTKTAGKHPLVTVTGANLSQLNAIAAATDGAVTASISGTTAALSHGVTGLATNSSDSITVTITDDGQTLAATDITTITSKTGGTVTVTNANTVTGTAANATAAVVTGASAATFTVAPAVTVTDNTDSTILATTITGLTNGRAVTVQNKVNVSGDSSDVIAAISTNGTNATYSVTPIATFTDSSGSTIDATTITGLTATVATTVSNDVIVRGSTAEVTAAVVTGGSKATYSGNPDILVTDNAATGILATALNAIKATTTGSVTLQNAIAISGAVGDVNTALIGAAAMTKTAGSHPTVTVTGANLSQLNAIAAATDGAVTASISGSVTDLTHETTGLATNNSDVISITATGNASIA